MPTNGSFVHTAGESSGAWLLCALRGERQNAHQLTRAHSDHPEMRRALSHSTTPQKPPQQISVEFDDGARCVVGGFSF